jgi:hypothetical protein
MHQAKVDKETNLLRLHFSQHVNAADAKSCAEKVEDLLAEVQPGFRLLTDLSGLEAMDLQCRPHINRVMDLCDDAGIDMVVRVIPDPRKDIGLNIMSLFHYRRGVRIITCERLDEALRVLGLNG